MSYPGPPYTPYDGPLDCGGCHKYFHEDDINTTDGKCRDCTVREIDTSNICDVEVDGIDTSDYPDFCDAFISAATWKDTGEELNDSEIDALNNEHDFVYGKVLDHLH